MRQYVHNYPAHMLHPSFAAVVDPTLPAGVVDNILFAFHLAQLKFAEVMNRRGNQPAQMPSQYDAQVRQFAQVSMNKAYIPQRLDEHFYWPGVSSTIRTTPKAYAAKSPPIALFLEECLLDLHPLLVGRESVYSHAEYVCMVFMARVATVIRRLGAAPVDPGV